MKNEKYSNYWVNYCYRKNFAIVDVYFNQLEYISMVEEPAYNVASLFST